MRLCADALIVLFLAMVVGLTAMVYDLQYGPAAIVWGVVFAAMRLLATKDDKHANENKQ